MLYLPCMCLIHIVSRRCAFIMPSFTVPSSPRVKRKGLGPVKLVRTAVAILGSLGVCIYVPASRHWLISYSPIHLNQPDVIV